MVICLCFNLFAVKIKRIIVFRTEQFSSFKAASEFNAFYSRNGKKEKAKTAAAAVAPVATKVAETSEPKEYA